MNTSIKNINATDLRDYAKSLGWKLVPEAVQDRLFVMSSSKYDGRQLVFPIDSDAPDYYDSLETVIYKLSDLLRQPVGAIISDIQEVKDDTLKFRVLDSRNEDSYLPLSYAVAAINGAKELFLSAASTVLRPQAHHPRMNRSEALELIEKSRFRQTEKGSFILKVSSPLNAMDIQVDTFGNSMPFVRQTTLTINKAVSELVKAIQTDTLDLLVDEIKTSNTPVISSNLCKAITNFHEEHDSYDLFLDFKWSGMLQLPSNTFIQDQIKIQKDYFPRIEEVKRELRNTEKHKEDVFMATVERLDGDIDDLGQRAGEIILNLYNDDEIIRARINLDADNYMRADKAHMTPGAFIKVKAKLHPGNQPRLLTDLNSFELILP